MSDNVTARHLMNIKRLAFETHPINPDSSAKSIPAIAAAESGPRPGVTWMEEIDKRIVLKAGNTPVWKKEEKASDVKPGTFGTGLSAEEVDRIAAAFIREIK